MKKLVLAIATAATVAASSVALPQHAEARGGRIAAGIIGGLAAGAIVGSALAGPRYYYGPGHYYAPAPYAYYDEPAYVVEPSCYWQRERIWNGWAWRLRRVRVCD